MFACRNTSLESIVMNVQDFIFCCCCEDKPNFKMNGCVLPLEIKVKQARLGLARLRSALLFIIVFVLICCPKNSTSFIDENGIRLPMCEIWPPESSDNVVIFQQKKS